jgi:hypothetical protein
MATSQLAMFSFKLEQQARLYVTRVNLWDRAGMQQGAQDPS